MLSTLFSSILAFIGTNIDDILILTLLVSGTKRRGQVFAGYCLGVELIALLSAKAAFGLRMISGEWLRLLGLVPIALGVRAWMRRDDDAGVLRTGFLGAMLITLGNGADNLGVYIPLFARSTPQMVALSALVFLMMAVLWSLFAARIAALPFLRRVMDCRALVPAVLILLGLYVILL